MRNIKHTAFIAVVALVALTGALVLFTPLPWAPIALVFFTGALGALFLEERDHRISAESNAEQLRERLERERLKLIKVEGWEVQNRIESVRQDDAIQELREKLEDLRLEYRNRGERIEIAHDKIRDLLGIKDHRALTWGELSTSDPVDILEGGTPLPEHLQGGREEMTAVKAVNRD